MNLVLPQNRDAEQAVVGIMLKNNNIINDVINNLNEQDFGCLDLRYIFMAIKTAYQQNVNTIDDVIVSEMLTQRGLLEQAGGKANILGLLNKAPATGNIQIYCESVSSYAKRRKLIENANTIQAMAFDLSVDPQKITEEAERQVLAISKNNTTKTDKKMAEVIQGTMANFGKILRHEDTGGIVTGIAPVDKLLFKMENSDFVLLAARPSMGKTAFSLNILDNVAMVQRKPVGYFSLEMSADQLGQRMICSRAGVSLEDIKRGNISQEQLNILSRTAQRFAKAPIIMNDDGGLSIGQLMSIARRWKKEMDISCLIIDYIQLISGSGKSNNSRNEEVSEISRNLKRLAKELDIPIIALSQLSRAVESRNDKTPMLSDLRESGSLEQDADIVMFLYRDEYYHENSTKKNICDVIIAKHRNGSVGRAETFFKSSTTQFTAVSYGADAPVVGEEN